MSRHPARLAAGVAALVGLGLLTASAQDQPQRRESSVEAPAMSGITIDGDLKDWPAAMPRYPVGKILTLGP